MYDLTNEKNNNGKRTRSLSPATNVIQPSEALRSLRSMLREKNNEIERLEKKIKNSRNEITNLIIKFETASEEQQNLENELDNYKNKLNN